MNDGFSETEDAKVISNNGFVPLTGVLLAGYIINKQLFTVILPNGKILTIERYAVPGYSADLLSNFLEENIEDTLDRLSVLRLGKAVILKSSEFFLSNNEVFCVAVSLDKFIILEKGGEFSYAVHDGVRGGLQGWRGSWKSS